MLLLTALYNQLLEQYPCKSAASCQNNSHLVDFINQLVVNLIIRVALLNIAVEILSTIEFHVAMRSCEHGIQTVNSNL